MDSEKRNASGYLDLTAYKAVKAAYRKELTARRGRVMKKLFAAEAEGLRIVSYVKLIEKEDENYGK